MLPLAERLRVAIMHSIATSLGRGSANECSVIVARCPSWSAQLVGALRADLSYGKRVPYHAAAFSPVLVAFAHGKSNALVVSLGHAIVSMCGMETSSRGHTSSSHAMIVPLQPQFRKSGMRSYGVFSLRLAQGKSNCGKVLSSLADALRKMRGSACIDCCLRTRK